MIQYIVRPPFQYYKDTFSVSVNCWSRNEGSLGRVLNGWDSKQMFLPKK